MRPDCAVAPPRAQVHAASVRPPVLFVGDAAQLRRLLAPGLGEEGFDVVIAANATDAVRHAEARMDLAVIDVGLPDADGRDLCQALRARGFSAPVLFLTARDAVTDRVSGFNAGGDDYVTKPFAFVELVARLRALQRRPPGTAPALATASPL